MRRAAAAVAVAIGTVGLTVGVAGAANEDSGHIRGKEVLDTAVATMVTGPVILKRIGSTPWHKTVHAHHGHFTVMAPVGRYLLTGKDGNAHCSPVRVEVRAGQTAHVTVTCSGM
jgi:hypothetical protein